MLKVHTETPITEIIEGGAKGADAMAARWAKANGVILTTVKADWDKYKKAAGFRRNAEMADLKPDLVICFPGGKGTNMMHDIAIKKGLKVLDLRNA